MKAVEIDLHSWSQWKTLPSGRNGNGVTASKCEGDRCSHQYKTVKASLKGKKK